MLSGINTYKTKPYLDTHRSPTTGSQREKKNLEGSKRKITHHTQENNKTNND